MDKKDKTRGCLAGLVVGDAFGEAVAGATIQDILVFTDGGGAVAMLPPITAGDCGQPAPKGTTTDETQLSLAVARSLADAGGLDLDDQARKLWEEYQRSTYGWGTATLEAAQALGLWLTSGGASGRSPAEAAPATSPGTGVAMKIAPLALWHHFKKTNREAFIEDAWRLGQLTHGDARASVAAAATGVMLQQVFRGHCGKHSIQEAYLTAMHCQELWPHDPSAEGGSVTEGLLRLSKVHRTNDSQELWSSVWRDGRPSFSALDCVPFALTVAARSIDRLNDSTGGRDGVFRSALREAATAGGNADLHASIVGAIVGAHVGLEGIPKDLLEETLGIRDALAAADDFFRAATAP